MRKPMRLLLIATVVTGAVAAGLAYAMPGGGERCHRDDNGMGHGGMGAETRIDRMADALDLSQKQRDQVRGIVDKSRPSMRELRDRMHDNRKQLRALMQQDKAPEGEIRRLADIQGKAIADMIVLRAQMRTEIRSVLTPEQREKIQSHRGQRRGPGAHGDNQQYEQQSNAGQMDELEVGSENPLAKRVSM